MILRLAVREIETSIVFTPYVVPLKKKKLQISVIWMHYSCEETQTSKRQVHSGNVDLF